MDMFFLNNLGTQYFDMKTYPVYTRVSKKQLKAIFTINPILILIAVLFFNIDNSNLIGNNIQKLILSFGLVFLSISWFAVNLVNKFRRKLFFLLLGPYLLSLSLVQSGLITDRSRDLRIASEQLVIKENLNNEKIEVIKSELGDSKTVSKMIKISLFMPRIGNGILSIIDLDKNQYAWTTAPKIEIDDRFTIVDNSKIFKPWKIIRRN